MASITHQRLSEIKWDIRFFLGLALVLAVLASFSFAAPGDAPIWFDFGGGAVSDQAAGMIAVKGSASPYPQTSGGMSFGWGDAAIVQAFVSPGEADLMRKDANGGAEPNTFTVAGLTPGGYTISAIVGSAEESFTTTMRIGVDVRSVATAPGVWKTMTISTDTTDGTVRVDFSGANVWAVSGLNIVPGATAAPASFALGVTPAQVTVTAGETANFQVSVTPLNDYQGNVSLSASGLAGGITATLTPAQLTALPGSATLLLSTNTSTPGVQYTILVRAIGDDANTVTKNATTTLNVLSADSGVEPVADGQEVIQDQPEPEVVDPAKLAADQALIDKFAAEQSEIVANRNDFLELRDINTDIVGQIPAVELPPPSTMFEGVLQRLTGSGIISIAADSAPSGEQVSPEPLPWWKSVIQAIFKRAD